MNTSEKKAKQKVKRKGKTTFTKIRQKGTMYCAINHAQVEA